MPIQKWPMSRFMNRHDGGVKIRCRYPVADRILFPTNPIAIIRWTGLSDLLSFPFLFPTPVARTGASSVIRPPSPCLPEPSPRPGRFRRRWMSTWPFRGVRAGPWRSPFYRRQLSRPGPAGHRLPADSGPRLCARRRCPGHPVFHPAGYP